jgi:hypothetical protein
MVGFTEGGSSSGEVDGGGGLADATLARGHRDDALDTWEVRVARSADKCLDLYRVRVARSADKCIGFI